MITLPWQIIVAAIVANAVVAVALIMQIRDRADRDTQYKNELLRTTRQSITEGMRAGHDFYLELFRKQKTDFAQQQKDAKK